MGEDLNETFKSGSTSFAGKLPYHCDVQTQYVYESNEHPKNLMSSMNEQRKRGILCDMTLVVQGTQVKAHRAVLASCSSYFNKVIMDPENLCHNIVLELSNVSKLALECILDFAYTSKLTISKRNISEVFYAVKILDMKNIDLACISHIQQKLFDSTEVHEGHATYSKSSKPNLKSCEDNNHQDVTQNFYSSPELNNCFVSEKCKLKGYSPNSRMNSTTKCYQNNVIDSTKDGVEKSNNSSTSGEFSTSCPAITNLRITNSSSSSTNTSYTEFPCNTRNCCMLESNKPASKEKYKPLEINTSTSIKKNQTQNYLSQQDYQVNNVQNYIKEKSSIETATCISFRDTRSHVVPETFNSLNCDDNNNLDKRNRNCTNVILPFTYEEITKSSRAELQEYLNMHPELTQKQLNTINELRKRGKNRIAAQKCRKRKMDEINNLQLALEELHKHHSSLMDIRCKYLRKSKNLKHNFSKLLKHTFDCSKDSSMQTSGKDTKSIANKEVNNTYCNYKQIAIRLERYDNELKKLCCKHQPLYPSTLSAIQEDDDCDDKDLILCCGQDNGERELF